MRTSSTVEHLCHRRLFSPEGPHEPSGEPFSSHEGSHEGSEKASGQGSQGPFLLSAGVVLDTWSKIFIHVIN